VEVRGGGRSDLGYRYGSYGSAYVTKGLLADIVEYQDSFCYLDRVGQRSWTRRGEDSHGFFAVS
jgi:hypothetical protein